MFDVSEVRSLLAAAVKDHNPDRRDAIGQTLLMVATHTNDVDACRSLLELGADPSASDMLGESPLLKAARLGFEPIVELLLAHGADPNGHHIEGWTPILVAALHAHVATAKILLAHGADLTRRTHTGHDLAHMARMSKNLEILALLTNTGT